jgi:CheY-like chemotaxis protein
MAFVLIVDDHVDTCHVMARLMRRLGREARCVHCGADALAIIRAEAPALVLLDISMPGMDGLETLGRIRSTDVGAVLPVVMLTAMSDGESRRQAINLGANDYLVKGTFDLPRLRTMLASHAPPVPP